MPPHTRLPQPVLAWSLLGAMLALAIPPAVHADAADAAPQLQALASEDYHERQAQTRQLLADTSLSLNSLEQLFQQAETPEQRHRLLAVARHHVLRLRREQLFDRPDRGSLGISHRTLPPGDLPADSGRRGAAVEIVLTLPGFPAHAVLEPGDHIIAIDGKALPRDFTAEHFRDLIINYRSGETIQLTVDRNGEEIDCQIELVSAQALSAMYDPGRLRLRPQFEVEWTQAQDRLLAHVAEPRPLTLPKSQ